VHIETVRVPDLGGAEEVEVIELAVAVGDTVEVDQTLLVLESEKATMELPSPVAGVVRKILVAEGDKVEREGVPLMEIEVSAAARTGRSGDPGAPAATESAAVKPAAEPVARDGTGQSAAQRRKAAPARAEPAVEREPGSGGEVPEVLPGARTAVAAGEATVAGEAPPERSGAAVYAGPQVRKLARELGIELAQVPGSGPRRRVLKEDVQSFVRARLQTPAAGAAGGAGIPPVPAVDYARFGPVSGGELNRIGRLTASNMHRNWLNVPHVTQFDAADITELEAFRRGRARDAEARGVKLTPVPFILKACAAALRDNPALNRALGSDGASYVQREYFHLGLAVDTERGLLVPVIRDVDRKGIWELAAEVAALAERARAGKLRIDEMQGACFTLSSLGAIGGEGFTPIINAPEVAILGVSRSAVRPVWNGTEFVPRTLLPLSLSYDHRLVNGAAGGRFLTQVAALLADIRGLLL
jgi:pyruvate dehydrogenase E2 component (dihydrolipoamide acetyltransferase)